MLSSISPCYLVKMASVLIVGSNRGIGLELVRHYAKRGDTVFAACRKASPELAQEKNVTVIENIDISTDSGMDLKLILPINIP